MCLIFIGTNLHRGLYFSGLSNKLRCGFQAVCMCEYTDHIKCQIQIQQVPVSVSLLYVHMQSM